MFKRSLAVALLVAGIAGCSSGGDVKGDKAEKKTEKKALKDTEVPKPVADALSKAHPAAKTPAWVQDGDTYEVKFEDGAKFAMDFAADGSVKEVEQEIALDAAPDAVKKGVAASKYGKMTVLQAKKQEKTAKPVVFKFVFKDGEAGWKASFDADGKVTKEKEIAKEKFEKWLKDHPPAK